MSVEAPRPERRPHVHTEHGVARPDPYHWLRDRDDPAVLAHLEAENAYTDALTAGTKALQEALYAEMLGRIQEDDTSVETPWGPHVYYDRTEAGRPYRVHCRRPRAGGPEAVLLDENVLAEGHDFFHLGVATVSPDHRYLAYAVDFDGSERYRLRVRDLATGEDLPFSVDGIKPSVAWAADGRTLLWTTPDATDRPWQIWRGAIDAPVSQAEKVLEEPDGHFFLGVRRTRDDAFLVLTLDSQVTSEVHVLPADAPWGAPIPVHRRRHGVEVELSHQGSRFLLRTNEGAVNFQLVAVPDDDPEGPREVVVPHDPDVFLAGVTAFADHLVLHERRDGLPRLRVLDVATGSSWSIGFPDPTYEVERAWNPDPRTTRFRFVYTSLVAPPTTFEVDLRTRERVPLKVQPVPGYDAEDYVTERLWATSHDGVRVPISLVRRRDTTPDGDVPVYLVGYGAYGILYTPSFRATVLPLLDRGFVYAIAHVRGGGELGRPWYEAGKLERKPNTFADFIAVAEHLVSCGWTRPERIAIQGGSAGGLLIGAVLNARPDRFGCAIARVPFVDVVTTMLDETLPLTVVEYDEWGDPHDREVFDRLCAYSPYDNVAAQDYPPILVTAGLNDPRVGYWEPAKWVARLRDRKTDDHPVLLRCHMGAGHQGASGRYGRLEDLAFLYAFALTHVGR